MESKETCEWTVMFGLHTCQHQRTKKLDKADNKTEKSGKDASTQSYDKTTVTPAHDEMLSIAQSRILSNGVHNWYCSMPCRRYTDLARA